MRTGMDTDDNRQGPPNLARHAGQAQARQMISSYAQPLPPARAPPTQLIPAPLTSNFRLERPHRSQTKAQVKDKLREAVADLEAGVTTDAGYTVQDAVTDFRQKGLKGRTKGTIDNYRSLADHNVIPQIGGIKGQGTDGRPA